MNINDLVPDLAIHSTNAEHRSLKSYENRWLILYFYPKDATPGCTIEARDFRDAYDEFRSLNAEIVGVSRDSLKSHVSFKEKHSIPFELISDETEDLCNLFDVMRDKSMYGKTFRGIERSTFIIDPYRRLKYQWRRVKVIGHIDAVKHELLTLMNNP